MFLFKVTTSMKPTTEEKETITAMKKLLLTSTAMSPAPMMSVALKPRKNHRRFLFPDETRETSPNLNNILHEKPNKTSMGFQSLKILNGSQ